MNSTHHRKNDRGTACCGNVQQVRGVDGIVCVSCGTVNQSVMNIMDSTDSYYFNELAQVSGGVLESEKRKCLKNARELVTVICENIKDLVYKDDLIVQTLGLIERCYEIRGEVERTDDNYLAFPKDLNLLYCACMVHVINTNHKFVGRFSVVDDILNQCEFKCRNPRDKLRSVVSEIAKNRLLIADQKDRLVVGESERLSEGLKVFLNEISAPGKLADYMMGMHKEAVSNVWFNGKKPGIIAAAVLYHVFSGECACCAEAVGRMVIKQHRGSLVPSTSVQQFIDYYKDPDKKELFLAKICGRFEVNLTIVRKCDEIIMLKHEKNYSKKELIG